MNYVKIGLEEYDRLKKSHDALMAKKKILVTAYDSIELYYTESETIDELTKRINFVEKLLKITEDEKKEKSLIISNLEKEIEELNLKLNKPKIEVKGKSLWDIFK